MMPAEVSGGRICNGQKEIVLAAMEGNEKGDKFILWQLWENTSKLAADVKSSGKIVNTFRCTWNNVQKVVILSEFLEQGKQIL